MTTIAFRDGVVASDSFMSSGNTIVSRDTKKILCTPDLVFCFAGKYEDGISAFKWAQDQSSAKPNCNGSAFWFFDRAGAYGMDSGLIQFPLPLIDGFASMGTGDDIALGAMAYGASAEEAVSIACQLDAFTGGHVVTLDLRQHFLLPDWRPHE